MTTRRNRSQKPAAPSDVKVTPEESKIEVPSAPVNIETETPSDEPVAAPEPPSAEKVQAEIREKLGNKSLDNSPFVPSNPAALESAAAEIAKEAGFELNRGTSIGALLMARARKRI